MSDYIKKNDVRHLLLHNDREAAIAQLDELESVDAVPVVHGEWTNRRTWTHDGEWYCTACDKEITIYMGEKRGNDRYNYCPNCGAKMDGGKADADS